ncbi:MAG: hypothetical protein NZ899_13070 [Thermoguttaceae bacterium]|nr:hypothetical protein [Thermoguttaceae bacterium]MDW8079108.1 hypothetical protein [Thermoguttaceae bacterium]
MLERNINCIGVLRGGSSVKMLVVGGWFDAGNLAVETDELEE